MSEQENKNIIKFTNNEVDVSLRFEQSSQAVWASAQNIADIFETDLTSIRKHINNIYNDNELDKEATRAKFARVQIEGGRPVEREVPHYNLDMILSVGYRVNSKKATKFRQWSTNILKTYLEQGYVLNEEALKGSPDKLNKLAAEIRALRFEEIQVYAKVKECFKISSSDYDSTSKEVKSFYALLQDKFHHAVTGLTSSKLLMDRADFMKPNMGLQYIKGDIPTLAEAQVGKNYLKSDELYRLHILSEQFLLFAESTALQNKKMTMSSLHQQLDRLLILNNYEVLGGYEDFLRDSAKRFAKEQLTLYKKIKKLELLDIDVDEILLLEGEYDYLLEE